MHSQREMHAYWLLNRDASICKACMAFLMPQAGLNWRGRAEGQPHWIHTGPPLPVSMGLFALCCSWCECAVEQEAMDPLCYCHFPGPHMARRSEAFLLLLSVGWMLHSQHSSRGMQKVQRNMTEQGTMSEQGNAERAGSGKGCLVKGYDGDLENCGWIGEDGWRRMYHCCFKYRRWHTSNGTAGNQLHSKQDEIQAAVELLAGEWYLCQKFIWGSWMK